MLAQLRLLSRRTAPERDSADLRHRELERALETAAKGFAQRRSLEAFTAEQARLNAEIDALRAMPAHVDTVSADPDEAIAALQDLKATSLTSPFPAGMHSAELIARRPVE
jgi:hypothetical protein